ncbi:hypothetical protein [Gracilinema caldarium]|uniref:Uncharacterized protein n=1 Tax=Gracilinema caldarium (strain ATCC 51460 / DSM 7334 / H1) TaxID=744872 RepID=F8F3P6_GRAC1|nr:hypothetical protein [Gracilinema caldarium]AEJ19990.1 hypothetical protein Spica_1853 [Gracilinema caldarium DSM 7334]
MKLNRTWLLWIIGSLGVAMILYAVAKQIIGFSVDPALEKTFFDFIIIGALGILIYNRKLAAEEAAEAQKSEPAPEKASEAADDGTEK